MKKALFFLLIFLLLPAISMAGGSPNMKPGLWEITTKSQMQGMNIPPSTITQCLTEDDMVPTGTQPGQECEVIDMKVSGNTVTWTMICSGQGGDVESTGRIEYHGTSFQGSMTTVIDAGGMTIESTITGKRLGDCK